MQVTTASSFEGYRIREYKGLVRGIAVRAPTLVQRSAAAIQGLLSPEIKAFVDICEEARQQAYEQLAIHAEQVGANAIIGLWYDASELGGPYDATEVSCYGTAVVIERDR